MRYADHIIYQADRTRFRLDVVDRGSLGRDDGRMNATKATAGIVLAGCLLVLLIGGGCTFCEAEYVYGDAVVETIEIAILESFPVQIRAVLRGDVPDACTAIDSIVVQREGSTFTLVVRTRRPADAICAQVLTPYETTTGLDVLGLPAGIYTVVAGEASASFELVVDNSPQSVP